MRHINVPEPGILSTAVTLYVAAVVWTVVWGVDTFIAGILTGCGSIMIGVWLGFIVAHEHHPNVLKDESDTYEDEDEDEE